MKFAVHTSRSEAVCVTSGGKMISYTHDKISYLCPGDSEHVPVCFPVVSDRENVSADVECLRVLSENDFASGYEFVPVLQMPEKVSFSLEDNTDTHKVSPCCFKLTHTYTVNDQGFSAKHLVNNRDTCPIAYRFGTEPVFSLLLAEDTTPDEYRLEISSVDAVLTAKSEEGKNIRDFVSLDGSKDNIIHLANISSDMTALVVDEPIKKQIKLYSEKTGHGLQIDLVGFRSLTVYLYKNRDTSHIYLKILNFIPEEYTNASETNRRDSELYVPADGEYTVGYVVTVL